MPPEPAPIKTGEISGLAFFFALGCIIYFKNAWLFYEFFGVIILASAWMWNRLPTLPRVAVALVIFLSASIDVHRLLKPNLFENHVLIMPSGDQLSGSSKEITRIVAIKAVVDSLISKQQNAVFVVGVGSGWHHYFNWSAANRNSVWLMAGFVRPYDESTLIASLDRTAAVIVYQKMPSTDPKTWNTLETASRQRVPSGLSLRICNVFAQRLGHPFIIDDVCWVYPVLPSSK